VRRGRCTRTAGGGEHGGHLILTWDFGESAARLRRAEQDPGIRAEPAARTGEGREGSRRCRAARQRGPRVAGGVLVGQPPPEHPDIQIVWTADTDPAGVL
jgi:hypothetical protein